MSRFARLAEEVLLRHKELAVEHHKTHKMGRGSLETLFLYECILVHSWETGICKKTIKELCEIYDLDYDNSTRRAKTLRQKGWLEDTKKHLRPLLIHRPDDKKTVIATAEKQTDKTVIITAVPTPKTVTVTAKKDEKTVTVTAENCNDYSQQTEKTVTVTAENAATHDEISDSADAMIFKDLKSVDDTAAKEQKTAAAAVETNGHKSIFSIEECLRYSEICARRGEPIKSVEALAKHAYKTGEMDAFIQATLYSELPVVEQTIVYDEESYLPATEPLSDTVRESSLVMLRGMLRDTSLDGLQNMAEFYTADDWAWLMAELNGVEK